MSSGGLRLLNLNAYERHKLLVNQYLLTTRGATKALQRDTSRDKRDIDVIREHHRFLWDDDKSEDTWELRLAKKYYDKLFKEYCICDLSRYKENKVAMRWRVESEVVSGKGQFSCGNKSCGSSENLRSWEVNFGYSEKGEKKNALVKLRLCPPCSDKLNYHHKKREVKRQKRKRLSSRSPVSKTTESRKTQPETTEEKEKSVEAEPTTAVVDEEIWKQAGANTSEEKSRDDEFQEYLEDLFL